jgi:membrane-associated phospholipid phosphatase
MPVQDADPPLQPSTWLEHGLEVNRVADQTKNAFPSMHVGLAVLLTLIGLRVCRGWGLVLGVATAVIVVSTLLVKQHFLADLPAGAIVGWAAFRAVYGPVTGGPAAPARDAPSGP